MKKLLLAGIAAAFFWGAPASAQWSGPSAGGSAGGGWGNSGQTDAGFGSGNNSDGHYTISGGLIGGTLGYNWQNGPWVFGVETDYSWANIKGQSDACGSAPLHPCGTKLESFGTVRARIGMPMGGASAPYGLPTKAAPIPTRGFLPYITGGFAFGDVNGWDSLTPASGSKMYTGWTIGAGIEWQLQSNWSAKIEYLYADLGKRQLFDVVPGVPETVSVNVNVVRVGLNYKFGDPWGKAPVSAKY
jgi:outer membrane immunogenic protein